MGGWSRGLNKKPTRKRMQRVQNPSPGEVEAAVVSLIRDYVDSEALGESVARLRDRYGDRAVNSSIDVVSRIFRAAENDMRTAFVVSQRPGWDEKIRNMFRRAFPELAKEADDMGIALETYVRFFLDDKSKNRLGVSESNLREMHGRQVLPWIRAIWSVYHAGNFDRNIAFGISQGSGWRIDVKGLFRRSFPDIAAEHDKWAKRHHMEGGG